MLKFFRNKVFRRVFIIYSAVIITAMLTLSVFVTQSIRKTLIRNQLYLNEKMVDDVNQYFKNQNDATKNIVDRLYSNNAELWDIINFLNYDYETYIKRRLDNYYNYEGYIYGGVNSFLKSSFNLNKNIENIVFYSTKSDKFAIFDSLGTISYEYGVSKSMHPYASEEKMTQDFISLLKSYDKSGSQDSYYYTLNKIKDPNKLDSIGLVIIKYRLNSLKDIISKYEEAENYIVAVNKDGEVLYDSSSKYTGKIYPYINMLEVSDKPVYLDKYSYVDFASSTTGISVLGILPVDNALKNNSFIITTSYILAFILIILAELIVFFKIEKLSNRVYNIIQAMKEVQKGNLKVKINTGNEDDEFALISDSFNKMCEKLDGYINRVYLSEIKQKDAEMLALQSQINPHFLYNTLEAIRMKAVSNKDRDTAKMLYNLSVLYRNMVKGKTFIAISEELEHCKLYLELFKFRYAGKFDYCIDFQEELKSKEIIKLTLQPLIENFIVHGIDTDKDDNYILITGEKDDKDIIINIEDNGKGIDPEKAEELNEKMQKLEHSDSIGLINVHERIKLTYGENYGLTIKSRSPQGTTISIRIPVKEVAVNV
ncbi:sensor histidine kinase [Clostridium swellfunianum]|uniref:sensor histidine kinase n=1 Tax=Clostridium swellfunianum TaxID=1367462 RepID=UPI00202FE5A2|nr:histidine kinase [Clostridium swellfunianum]MCM0647325.1 sensor histidine kinase [Clostridium swellfunianum]